MMLLTLFLVYTRLVTMASESKSVDLRMGGTAGIMSEVSDLLDPDLEDPCLVVLHAQCKQVRCESCESLRQ